jgi:hypothetical protein
MTGQLTKRKRKKTVVAISCIRTRSGSFACTHPSCDPSKRIEPISSVSLWPRGETSTRTDLIWESQRIIIQLECSKDDGVKLHRL